MKTQRHILVLNSGSSSFKFSLYEFDSLTSVVHGAVSALGTEDASISLVSENKTKEHRIRRADHREAIEQLLDLLEHQGFPLDQVAAAGHRVVHGGERFHSSVIIDDHVIEGIRTCIPLAPLHNPANLQGIEVLYGLRPDLVQVAVFDTAFHQTLPEKAFLYALPLDLYRQHQVRRYGFHGTSHRYVSQRVVDALQLSTENHQLLVAHLGNGCSATAIINGRSVDTTMGLTPLEGMMMGTRSGDVDPGLHQYLHQQLGWDLATITQKLNKESGLAGVSGISHDMRKVYAQALRGNAQAKLAFELFCFRAAKAIGALAVSLSRIDALVFTGGIGEHHPETRSAILKHLTVFGFQVDETHNAVHGTNNDGIISVKDATCAMVVPTDEEKMIAQDCQKLVSD